MTQSKDAFTYFCTRCRLRKGKTREEPHYIFKTEIEVRAHLKTVHGIDNPREDTIDDYSVAVSVSLPERIGKKLLRKGSPFHIEKEKV